MGVGQKIRWYSMAAWLGKACVHVEQYGCRISAGAGCVMGVLMPTTSTLPQVAEASGV